MTNNNNSSSSSSKQQQSWWRWWWRQQCSCTATLTKHFIPILQTGSSSKLTQEARATCHNQQFWNKDDELQWVSPPLPWNWTKQPFGARIKCLVWYVSDWTQTWAAGYRPMARPHIEHHSITAIRGLKMIPHYPSLTIQPTN